MVSAYNETLFNQFYNEALKQLTKDNASNQCVEEELEKFYNQRHYYANYIIKNIPGNRGRKGSVAAEQNHSSIASLIFTDKNNKNYFEHVHVMIRDLFVRQKKQSNEFNSLLFGLTNKRNIVMEQIESNKKQSVNYQIMKDALNDLNFNSYILFEKELKNSRNYVSQFVPSSDNASNMCIEVKRTDMDTPGRIFTTMDQRCNCEVRISHLIMCRHEIILHKKFNIKLFDIMHHYRSSVTMSFKVGANIEYNRQCSGVLTEILDAIDDDQQMQTNSLSDDQILTVQQHQHEKQHQKEHQQHQQQQQQQQQHYQQNHQLESNNKSKTHQSRSSNNDNDQNTFESSIIEIEESNFNEDMCLNDEHEFLNQNHLKNINNEIFNYYQKNNIQTKQTISSLLIMIRDYAKTNGNTKNQHELSPDDKMLQTQQLQNIIQSYNMSFLTDKNTFNTSNMILTDKNINKCRSKNRKMPIHEQLQRKKYKKSQTLSKDRNLTDTTTNDNAYSSKGRKRLIAEPKCSFCSTTGHKISTCPVLSNFKVTYKVILQNQMYEYIHYLKSKVPILDPDDSIQVKYSALLAQDHNHLIIHKEVYAKMKSQTNSYGTMDMKEMMFTISIISMHNASILQDKIVVNGDEVSTYIHNQINKKQNKFLFDGTKIEGMYSFNYHQRQNDDIYFSQSQDCQNLSQPSNSQRQTNDPPEDGFYYM